MTAPTLTQRQLQRAVLARQSLLERAPAATTVPSLLSGVAGLQTQYAPTAYIGLWSRLDGFQRDDLTNALSDRSVVQATLMRDTIHVVAAQDYWPLRLATIDTLRAWFLRLPDSPDERTMRAAAERVRTALDRHHRLPRKELVELAGEAGVHVGLWIGLVRAPPSGTWDRRRADVFAAAESWLGPPPELTVDEAKDHLVRRYLNGFGPASAKEIATFCSMRVSDVAGAAERVAERRWHADDGTVLLDLDGLPLPDADTAVPVRFLGNWEALLLVHARRALLIRKEDRPRIFTPKLPQSLPTFLVDGQVAGTWKYADDHVELDVWRQIDKRSTAEVRDEADRLADFHRS